MGKNKNNEIIKFIDKTIKINNPRENISKEFENEIKERVKVGTLVSHSSFGKGRIKSIEGDLLEVDFKSSLRKFSFPSAFTENYLLLED